MNAENALLHASRAEQRRQRLLEAERESAAEEAEALTITEEQRQTLLRPFLTVKAEFADLDGLRWTQTALRRRQDSLTRTGAAPEHRPQYVPTNSNSNISDNASSSTFAVLTNADLASFAPDDTIRVPSLPTRNRPKFPSPLIRGTTPLPTTSYSDNQLPQARQHAQHRLPKNHRDGTRQRSPVKGLFSSPTPPSTTFPSATTCYESEYESVEYTPRPTLRPDLSPIDSETTIAYGGVNRPPPPGLGLNQPSAQAPNRNHMGPGRDIHWAPPRSTRVLLESHAASATSSPGGRGPGTAGTRTEGGGAKEGSGTGRRDNEGYSPYNQYGDVLYNDSPPGEYYSRSSIMGSALVPSSTSRSNSSSSSSKVRAKSNPLHHTASDLTLRAPRAPSYTPVLSLLTAPLPSYPSISPSSNTSPTVQHLPRRRISASSKSVRSKSSSGSIDIHPAREAPSPPPASPFLADDPGEEEDSEDEFSSSLLDPPSSSTSSILTPRRGLVRAASVVGIMPSSSSVASTQQYPVPNSSPISSANRNAHRSRSPRARLASLLAHSPSETHSHQHTRSTSSPTQRHTHAHKSYHSESQPSREGSTRHPGLTEWSESAASLDPPPPHVPSLHPFAAPLHPASYLHGTIAISPRASSTVDSDLEARSDPSRRTKDKDKHKHKSKSKTTNYPALHGWLADVSLATSASAAGESDVEEETPRGSPVFSSYEIH